MSLFSDEDISVRKVYVSGPMASRLFPVPYSTTPVFDAGVTNVFQISLHGDVTSSSLVNAVAGQRLTFMIAQDNGSHLFTWPSNVRNAMLIGDGANQLSIQEFVYDGVNAYPVGPPTVNDLPVG